MKIFGYNNEKQVIQVDLTIKTILKKQIDPWHVDLFEPNPAILKVGEQQLHFSKLRRITFAYGCGSKAILCTHNDSETACLESEEFERSEVMLRLNNVRKNELPPQTHLARLYELQGRLKGSWSGNKNDWIAVASDLGGFKLSGSCIEFARDEDEDEELVPNFGLYPQFTGEMFRTVPVPTVLPPEINWVFETFNLVKPLVHGELLREVLSVREKDLRHIEFSIDEELRDQLHQLARNQPGLIPERPDWWGKFRRGETVYVAWNDCLAERFEAINNPYYYRFTHCSTDGVSATGVNQVTATRIALFDIAQHQTRPLSLHAQIQAVTGHGSSIYLPVPQGWSLEPTVFLEQHLNWKAFAYKKSGKVSSNDSPALRALAA